ncbi:MAG: ABC transporter permease [Clostridiales bacterium]|jgi:ABC-2 type transport system permease protein|nr:ABC transporter permease [Clostridiales bacterium]
MLKQIRAEFLKLRKSSGFLTIAVVMLVIAGFMSRLYMSAADPVTGYEAFKRAITTVELQILFVGIFAAVFICDEFQNRTIGASVYGGNGRLSVVIAKLVAFFSGVLVVAAVFLAIIIITLSIVNGFGEELTTSTTLWLCQAVFLYLLGCVAMASFSAMISYIAKSVLETAIFCIGLTYGVVFVAMRGPENIGKLTFIWHMAKIQNLAGTSGMFLSVAVFLATILVTGYAAYAVFKRTDLK